MSSSIKKPKKGGPKSAVLAAPREPLSDGDYARLLLQAQQLVDEMNYQGAVMLYEEALECRPTDTKVMDAIGEASYNLGDLDRAERVLSQSAELAPTDGYSKWMYLGQIYEGTESALAYSKGIALLERALEAALGAASSTGGDGTVVAEERRLRRELSDGHCSVVELYMTDLCDDAEAESVADAQAELAVSVDDSNPEAHRVLASLRLCQNNRPAAMVALARSVALIEALYPPEVEDEEDGAARHASAATTVAPTPHTSKKRSIAAATATASVAEGGEAVAAAEVDLLSQIPPFDARLQLAKNCMEVELYEPAVTLLDRLLEEDDSNMEVWYLAGEANLLGGDCESAVEHLTSADEMLQAAIDRITAIARRAGVKVKGSKGKAAPAAAADAAAYVTDGLMGYDLDELLSQQTMIRKLLQVAQEKASAGGAGLAAVPEDDDIEVE